MFNRHIKKFVYGFLLIICLPVISLANGVGGNPGKDGITLIPSQTDSVQMVSEVVNIDLKKGNVHCLFVFKNVSNKPQIVTMLFPFSPYYDQDDEDSFEASVDNEDVDVMIKDLEANPSFNFTKEYKKGASWKVAFKAHEEKRVECSYKVLVEGEYGDVEGSDLGTGNPIYDNCMGGGSAKEKFTYITRTGALWANKIEKAQFYVIVPEYVIEALQPTERYNLYCLSTDVSILPPGFIINPSQNTIAWTFTQWKPDKNIELSWEDRFLSNADGYEIFKYKRYTAHQRIYKLNELSLIANNFSWIEPDYLAYLRNEIYARHGKVFENDKLQKFFAATLWYKPRKAPTELNEIEIKNVKFLIALEQNIEKLMKDFQKRKYDGDTTIYTEDTIKSFAAENTYLQFVLSSILRNEIYARKGMCFKNSFYRAFFNSTLWYKTKCYEYVDEDNKKIVLNAIEKQNADFLLNMEKMLYSKIGVPR